MSARRFGGRRRFPGRLAILAVLLLASCTVTTAGQAERGSAEPAPTTGANGAGPTSAPSPGAAAPVPPVTSTTVRPVPAAPSSVYRVATGAGSQAPPRLTGLAWWSLPVDTNGTSMLTTGTAHDDAASVYIPPTVPVQPKSAAVSKDSSTGNLWSGTGLSGRTNGQLIGVDGDQAYTCSGTVVHSARKNLVLTAGHCVWNIPVGRPPSKGGPAMTLLDQIWFVPGASDLSRPLRLDSDGQPEVQAPYGIWTVSKAASNQRWLQNTWVTRSGSGAAQSELMHGVGSYDDIAFLTVQPHDGEQIESVTGGQGLLFSDTSAAAAQITYPTIILGYPSAAPFDGSSERFCADAAPEPYDGDVRAQTAAAACSMTPGSSGGAWFTGFDRLGGGGYVYGVTSRGGETHLTVGMLSLSDDYPLYRKLGGA